MSRELFNPEAKAFENGLLSLGDSDDSAPAGSYIGTVEQRSDDYKNNGLIKVRVPILHGDMPLERLPWSYLTDTLRAMCIEWDDPKKIRHVGEGEKGELEKITASGPILTSSGTCPTGKVAIADPYKFSDGKGLIIVTMTPDPWTIRPYAQLRTGEHLIRPNDQVIVVPANGNLNQLVIMDFFKMA